MRNTPTDADRDAMVQQVIDKASIPGRDREPRLADHLVGVERVNVPTAYGTVAAWRVGEGPAVLPVHGWRDSARLWDPLMEALSERGRAFVAMDLPGHGFSGGDRCLIPEVATAVAAVGEALGPVRSMVVHSFACGGAALAVAEGLPIERLVLIAPPLAYRAPAASAGGATGASQRWRRIASELGFDPEVGDEAIARYLDSVEPRHAAWNLSEGLSDLDVEVLLLASVDDDRFDSGPAEAIAASSPNCRFVQLTGLDHRGSARGEPAVRAIVDFV